ncbi:glycosyltransferase family 2 protein [Piscinibacter sp. XHJ-5]|uniref:glycosyltransferase family 2 protein n=1 Tax=Piscinibacter sp. XHJ-5 TaxID=3037797 RepID=UPI0024530160|nr:glycosyltransferase family 2 protein [Piscinibacter sp. XHJ-5]
MNLSVILITRNEAHNIAACLQSVGFADEWIVVDSSSDDGTREIAERCGARVTTTSDWPGFGVQKNRALAQAQGRWVLSIDADERVSEQLAANILRVVADVTSGQEPHASSQGAPRGAVGYELSRLSSFCGQWMRHGDWYPDRVLRLFRRGTGRFSDDLVHERLLIDGPIGRLEGELLHDSMPTLENAIDKMNRYSSGRALDKVRAGRQGGLASALSHGLWAFIRCYLLRRGFLDGRLGLVLAVYVAEGTYYRYLKMGLLARSGAVNQPAKTGS